jgi:hypothetical protein
VQIVSALQLCERKRPSALQQAQHDILATQAIRGNSRAAYGGPFSGETDFAILGLLPFGDIKLP